MVLSGTYTAEIDRFRESVAVLVLQRDGDEVEEFAVDRSALPGRASHVGAEFTVDLAAGRIRDVEYHEDPG